MRRFMVLSLALCLLCALINMSSAHPLLDKLGIESKRQLARCPERVPCISMSTKCIELIIQGFNCNPGKQ